MASRINNHFQSCFADLQRLDKALKAQKDLEESHKSLLEEVKNDATGHE